MRLGRPVAVAALVAAAALVVGCDGGSVRISSTRSEDSPRGVLKVIDTLQCPETVGVLTRKGSAQAEGRVCAYSGPKGSSVSLHLVRLDGASANEVLVEFERRLSADLAHAVAAIRADDDQAQAEAARTDTGAGRAGAKSHAAAGDQASVDMPRLKVEAEGETATVRLPGMSIRADDDKAAVRIGGLRINATDASSSVDISTPDESVTVQTKDNAVVIRTRVPGEATRSTYILTDSAPSPQGWRLVGYEARGPAGGPIVIATVRSKERERDSTFEAAQELVRLNVGE